jgi:hypothetical protein
MQAQCQSCVVPLHDATSMGTTKDGAVQPLHCNGCMIKGELHESLFWNLDKFLPLVEKVAFPQFHKITDPETIKKYVAMVPTIAYWKAKGLLEAGASGPGTFICQVCAKDMQDRSEMGTDAKGATHPLYCNECFSDGAFTERVRGKSLEAFTEAAMHDPDLKERASHFATLLYWLQLPTAQGKTDA